MNSLLRVLTLGLLLFNQVPAQAHSRGTSYSFWTIDDAGADVRVRVSQLELTRLQLDPSFTPGYTDEVGSRAINDVQLWSAAGRCTASAPKLIAGEDGWLNLRWRLKCASSQDLTIRSQLLHEVAPSHLHFVRVTLPDGELRQRVLTYAEPAMELDMPQASAPASLGRYAALGIEHILSGWDHLAFVLALILLAASLREVAVVATGFTLAHSLTLAAAVLGWVQTRGEVVEALIGFSIALVAAENLWLRAGRERWLPWALSLVLVALCLLGVTRLPAAVLLGLALFSLCHFALLQQTQRPARLRLALAFVFGLVHGFGFAGVMAELNLPAGQLAVGLLGFNSGVELGQLLVIALVWPALRLLERWPQARRWLGDGGSAAICALGTYWFLIRGISL
ncbi:MAG: HupE/UreJ family protein [Nevskiales bacterium]